MKKLKIVLSIFLALVMLATPTFASVNQSVQLQNKSYIIIKGQKCIVKVLEDNHKFKVVKAQDESETTFFITDKATNIGKLISIPNSDKMLSSNDLELLTFAKDYINESKVSVTRMAKTYTIYTVDLKKIKQLQVPRIETRAVNKTINLTFSDLFYGYFGQYSISNKAGNNIRINGSDIDADHILYTEMDNFKDELVDMKTIEGNSKFEAAGTVIGVLLAIPDITVSKIAAILVAAGVAITSAGLIWNYCSHANDAEEYYNEIISRCKKIDVRYW